MSGKLVVGVVGVVVGVVGVVFAYLELAMPANYWPYDNPSSLTMTSPQDGYRFSDDFLVELSGSLSTSDRIWLAAKDADQSWYPLTEAMVASKDHWKATIRAEQVISPVELCAVKVGENGANEFRSFLQTGDPEQGLATLPSGGESLVCRNILPAA